MNDALNYDRPYAPLITLIKKYKKFLVSVYLVHLYTEGTLIDQIRTDMHFEHGSASSLTM